MTRDFYRLGPGFSGQTFRPRADTRRVAQACIILARQALQGTTHHLPTVRSQSVGFNLNNNRYCFL